MEQKIEEISKTEVQNQSKDRKSEKDMSTYL